MLYNTPDGFEIKRKTIQYLEQSLAHLIAKHGCLVVMIPSLEGSGVLDKEDLDVYKYADALDGLILQGGVDISPSFYGEEPLPVMSKHVTDPIRDRYELRLLKAFSTCKKPVLGICRGFQLMNVYAGGTLFQDLPSQRTSDIIHNKTDLYDQLIHEVTITPGGELAKIYPESGTIVSIHHQGVKDLGKNLQVEARSDDGLIEAFSSKSDGFYVGVQWHPEFHKEEDQTFLQAEPLVKLFLKACAEYKKPVTETTVASPLTLVQTS